MSRFRYVNERNVEQIRVVGGPATRGIIFHPPDQEDPGVEFGTRRLTLRVRPDSLIRTGQVIQCTSGRFVVADFNVNGDYRNHLLFQVDRLVTWTRLVSEEDPLTGLPRKAGEPENLGKIWVLWQRQRREYMDLPIRANQETTMTVTGSHLEVGDFLDGKRVSRVNLALGIRVVELQA